MNWYSQAGQDIWVHSIVGDSGYFVDVGAHDGIVHSNTYALEQLGWTGICIEPNEDAYEALIKNRPDTWAHPFVISNYVGWMPFDGVRVGSGPMRMSVTLDMLIPDADVPVDYLSVDVEGHELEVLASLDWDRRHVRCITIEHNLYSDGPARKNAIYDVLTGHGFERVREDVVAEGYGPYEDWYQHRDD